MSFLYFILFYVIFRQLLNPQHFFSFTHLFIFLCTCGLTIVHAFVTFINYWFVCVRWNRMVLFFIIAWAGIGGLFIFSLYLVLIF